MKIRPLYLENFIQRGTVLSLLLALSLLWPCDCCFGQAPRRVMAHYMTDMVPQSDRPLIRWLDPELTDPNGSTSSVGGMHLTLPMTSIHLRKAGLREAVEFEIRAAKQMGVDGFQFYYPLTDNVGLLKRRYNEIITAFHEACHQHHPEFRLTICLAHPRSEHARTEKARIELWSDPIRELVSQTKSSKCWLRGPEGNLQIYLWVGDGLADNVRPFPQTPAEIVRVAKAYHRLADEIREPIDFVYHVRRTEKDERFVDQILESFPAVWGWTDSDENVEFWDYLARRCKETGTRYEQTVYSDFCTSKLYRLNDQGYEILSAEEAVQRGVNQVERHYRVTHLAKTEVALLRKAIERNASNINYVSWNDFPEGHHLAAEQNHNFGPSLILRHFKGVWRTSVSGVDRDVAIAFFKKHPSDVEPKFKIHLKLESSSSDLGSEDKIQLVTMLQQPANCRINDHSLGLVPAGFQINSIPLEPGPVRVRVTRSGHDIISFVTPAKITNQPHRTDRLTYSFSSEYEDEFNRLFKADYGTR